MADFLNKIKYGNKEIFNLGIKAMKTGGYQVDKNVNLNSLVQSIISTGAIGSWLEYPDVVKENRVILGATTVYSIIIRDMLQNDSDISNAIMYMIKRNIESGLLEEDSQLEELQNQNLADILFKSTDIFASSLRGATYYETFINLYCETTLKRVKDDKNGIAAIRGEMVVDFPTFKKNHQIIKDAFLDKKDSYTELDIETVIKALNELEILPEVSEKVRKMLTISLNKRRNKELKRQTELTSKTSITKTPSEPKVTLSKKEYNTLYRELLTFYDLDNHQVIRPLTIKEVIYCIRLMLKLNISESSIDLFLKNINRENKKIDNPISLYIALYDKIKHYATDIEISKKISLIEDYLSQIFIATDEDYEFWKTMIGEELEAVTTLIPNDGTYEKEAARAFK